MPEQHWQGCWTEHLVCAHAEIQALKDSSDKRAETYERHVSALERANEQLKHDVELLRQALRIPNEQVIDAIVVKHGHEFEPKLAKALRQYAGHHGDCEQCSEALTELQQFLTDCENAVASKEAEPATTS